MMSKDVRQSIAMWAWWWLIALFCGTPLCALMPSGIFAFFVAAVVMFIAQILAGKWDWVINILSDDAR